jgi:hypothetical protein
MFVLKVNLKVEKEKIIIFAPNFDRINMTPSIFDSYKKFLKNSISRSKCRFSEIPIVPKVGDVK